MRGRTLAELVKGRRVEERFSQQALAKKVGVSRGTISQIESGETLRPTTLVLLGLAKALRLRIDDLMDAAGATSPPNVHEPAGTWALIESAIGADLDITAEERTGLMFLLTRAVKPVLDEAAARNGRARAAPPSEIERAASSG